MIVRLACGKLGDTIADHTGALWSAAASDHLLMTSDLPLPKPPTSSRMKLGSAHHARWCGHSPPLTTRKRSVPGTSSITGSSVRHSAMLLVPVAAAQADARSQLHRPHRAVALSRRRRSWPHGAHALVLDDAVEPQLQLALLLPAPHRALVQLRDGRRAAARRAL